VADHRDPLIGIAAGCRLTWREDVPRDCKYFAHVEAGQSEFSALFELADTCANGADRWAEVQPRYMGFHFEAPVAHLQFCSEVARRKLKLIASDNPVEMSLTSYSHASDQRMTDANAANAPKQPLFHYTNENALFKIIKSKRFWFSSIFHMDDTEELTFGFNVSRALLQGAIAKKGGLVRDFCRGLLEDDDLRKIIRDSIAFYSVSFGLRDDIQQWKRYGDHECGVALGLAPEFFSPAPLDDPDHPKPEEQIFYSKVSYGEADARARHSTVIEAAFVLIKQVQEAGWLRTKQDAATLCNHLRASMYPEILWNCVTTKESKWSEQNEMRLLARNFLKKPHLPIVNAHKKPRVEITQPRLRKSIVEVMIGPKAAPEVFTRVRAFLASHGLAAVPVTRAAQS
jgi:Protein of unknown function (DUF2971)